MGYEPVRSRPPAAPPATDWRGPLLSFLASLRPDRLPDEELEELDQLVRGKERLRGFPHHVQVSLLEYAAARLRYLQHRGVADARIQPFMAEIRSHADREGCGFVHGPKRTSGPTSSSWDSDARTHLNRLYDRALTDDAGRVNFGRAIAVIEELVRDAAPFEEVRPLIASAIRVGVPASNTRLVNLVAPFHGNMTDAPELRTLRGAIRTAERAARAPPEPEAPAIPADWPWLAFARGKRVVMIGGDPREPNRVRIEKAFAFGELVWEPTEFKPRSSDAVRDRISSGGVDFLIILRRFVGHDVDEKLIPVCETTGTPYVSVPNGYGIGRIRQEIEHRIPRPEPA
ncbi:hypothetical protein EBS80_05355 [bacterium]|nr:hypothetical protein [bacterium]